jgi:hypothetical protein
MAAPGDHNRAIALAAKAALAPLGFRRKGQSRVWLADQGYWLLVVEFQPSGWARGSYLNVAAHWLWTPPSPSEPHFHLGYNFGGRVAEFVDLADAAKLDSVTRLAARAARESARLRAILPSLDAAADAMIEAEAEQIAGGHPPSWGAYHAAIAAALTGKADVAVTMFGAVLAVPVPPAWGLHDSARVLLARVGDPASFRRAMEDAIAMRREAMGFAPIEAPFA